MIQITDFLHIELAGLRYLHNMVIHFPIGACGISILFLLYSKFFMKNLLVANQTLIFLSAITVFFCWISVVAGHATANSAGYQFWSEKWLLENGELGHMVVLHRFFGFLEAIVMSAIFLFSFFQYKKERLNQNLLLVLHLINFIIISITAHFGASIGRM